jgi:hypothetical protein
VWRRSLFACVLSARSTRIPSFKHAECLRGTRDFCKSERIHRVIFFEFRCSLTRSIWYLQQISRRDARPRAKVSTCSIVLADMAASRRLLRRLRHPSPRSRHERRRYRRAVRRHPWCRALAPQARRRRLEAVRALLRRWARPRPVERFRHGRRSRLARKRCGPNSAGMTSATPFSPRSTHKPSPPVTRASGFPDWTPTRRQAEQASATCSTQTMAAVCPTVTSSKQCEEEKGTLTRKAADPAPLTLKRGPARSRPVVLRRAGSPARPAGQGRSTALAPARSLRGPKGVFGKKTEKDGEGLRPKTPEGAFPCIS